MPCHLLTGISGNAIFVARNHFPTLSHTTTAIGDINENARESNNVVKLEQKQTFPI